MALPSSFSPSGGSPPADRRPRRRPARVLTILAAGFLLLDGALLGIVGWWDDRPGFLVLAGMFGAAAAGVLALRRRYLARLDEIAAARAALKQEAASLARALRERE